jgi:hypothetical protein
VQRHYREKLVNSPAVRDGLKYREIAVIYVCNCTLDVLQVRRSIFKLLLLLGDLVDRVPEDLFRKRTLAKAYPAMLEHVAYFIAVIKRVIVALLYIFKR